MTGITKDELMQMVKQVVDYEEDYELEEVYDGNCFHLTSSELSALLNNYVLGIVNDL